MHLLHHPSSYPQQPFFRFCGAFQIAAAISSLKKIEINHYAIFNNIIDKIWFCLPFHISKALEQYWYKTTPQTCKEDKKKFLIRTIQKNKNNILLIWHWYNKQWKNFSVIKAIIFQHYISVWGYNEQKNVFYIYDSSLKANNKIPIWNLAIDMETLIESRKWWWITFFWYTFISR